MSTYRIPFNKPRMVGKEVVYISEAVSRGQISGDGYYTKQCQEFLENSLNIRKVLMTTSCTHALEITGLLMDLQPGDEVIVPSFTFVSTVNAYALRGIKPVFADIRSDTLNLDETKLKELITDKTKAIIPVHYAGVGCNMDEILSLTNSCNITVVEDNAHGLFGQYKEKFLGSIAPLATLSFHETKNFICGEGGALLINDEQFIERAEVIREKGTNRSKFFRGEIDKYSWVDFGSSYVISDILAAYLYAQLEEKESILNSRKFIWDYYHVHLADWAKENNVKQPTVPAECTHAFHMYYVLMPTAESRDRLIKYLKDNDILSVFHYLPLHLSEMGQKYGGSVGDCPVTEDIAERLLRLPFYNEMTEDELEEVVGLINKFQI